MKVVVLLLAAAVAAPLALFDAWLSMQSLFGLMAPENLFGQIAVVILGFSFTGGAILLPWLLESEWRSFLILAVCGSLFVFDVATSAIGAVWYGQLGHGVDETVDLDQMKFVMANAAETFGYVLVVFVIAGATLVLGHALKRIVDYSSSRG